MKSVHVVCDGSALGNGQAAARAGAAALLVFADSGGQHHRRVVGEYLGQATNNQAEIVAACIGLEALSEPCRVRVTTDSKYVVETLRGNFRRKKNHEFWARLDLAANPHHVDWTWTRGHAGHPDQELCDRVARRIAKAGVAGLDQLVED